MSRAELPLALDLAPYVGRWIAVVRGQVAGVGKTADEARQLALHNRPKETPALVFVSAEYHIARQVAQIPLIEQIFDWAHARHVEIYLVGGSVRDLLMGLPVHDLDFAVADDGLAVARPVADLLRAAYVPIDPERKTGRVILPEGDLYVDIAALRGPDLLADLRDRDFTINAMALVRTVEGDWQLIDPLGGQGDLQQGILRAAAPTSFEHDPLRTLRAVRMCAQFHCTLDPFTESALRRAAAQLGEVSAERLRDEWFKLLALPGVARSVARLDELGLLEAILPELANGGAHRPAWAHALGTVEALERLWAGLTRPPPLADEVLPLEPFAGLLIERYVTRLCDERTHLALLKCAALLHDLTADPTRSAHLAAEIARRWRCSNREIAMLHQAIVAQAHLPELVAQTTLSRRDLYRFYRVGGEYGIDAVWIALACYLARRPAAEHTARWRRWMTTAARLVEAYYLHRYEVIEPPLLLNGHDLLALGVEPGPQVGDLLAALREEQAAGEITDREQALAFVRQYSVQKGKL